MSTPVRSRSGPTTRVDILSLTVAAVGFAAALLVAVPALRLPPHVDGITVDNPHPWPAHVQANAADDDGWLGLGTVDQEDENAFHSVVAQGDRWVFRFSYGGTDTELHVTTAQLEHDNWRITVPDAFASELRAADQPEAPTPH